MPLFYTYFGCATLALVTVLLGRWLAKVKPIGSFQLQLASMAYRNFLFLVLSLLWFSQGNLEKDEKMNLFLIYFFCYLSLILVDTILFISSLKKN